MKLFTGMLAVFVASLFLFSCCRECLKDGGDAKVEAVLKKLRSARLGPVVCPSGPTMKDVIDLLRNTTISENCQNYVLSFAHEYLQNDEAVMWLPDLLGVLANMGNGEALRELELICLLPPDVCCVLYFHGLWLTIRDFRHSRAVQKVMRENVLEAWEVFVKKAAKNLALCAPNEAVVILTLAGLACEQKRKIFKRLLAELLGASTSAEFEQILFDHRQEILDAARNARTLVIPRKNMQKVLSSLW